MLEQKQINEETGTISFTTTICFYFQNTTTTTTTTTTTVFIKMTCIRTNTQLYCSVLVTMNI